MRQAMNNTFPTPETLQQWAENGNAEQVDALLSHLQTGDRENISAELLKQATAAGMRLTLADTFILAQQDLSILADKRPESTETEYPSAQMLAEEAETFKQDVSIYLQALKTGVEDACAEDDKVACLQSALRDEKRQKIALRQLATIGDIDAAWLKEQAHMTTDDVTASLWEAVTTGREAAALISDTEGAKSPQSYLEDWKLSIEDGFSQAAKNLQQATDWLTSNN